MLEADSESPVVEEFKEAIVQCFAALTEKLEDARSEFVVNTKAVGGLILLLTSEPKLTTLQLAAFDLLRSLGRSKLAKKKILRERFHDKRVDFVERVSKQFIICTSTAKHIGDEELKR